MNIDTALNALFPLLIIVAVAYRQLRTKQVSARHFLVPLVLAVVGITSLAHIASSGVHVTLVDIGTLVLAAALGALLAIPRGFTIKLWRQNGVLWMKGTGWTLMWWVLTFGLRAVVSLGAGLVFGHQYSSAFASASIPLMVGISLGLQALIVEWRGRGGQLPRLAGLSTVASGPAL